MKQTENSQTFPGFSVAFNLKAMAMLIEEAFYRDDAQLRVIKCDISDVKYDPGIKCILLYKTKVRDRDTRSEWEVLTTGVLLKKDESYTNPRPKEVFLKEHRILLLPFPHDHILSWLPDMYHETSIKKLLRKSQPKISLNPLQVNVSTLIYKPQMRATFEYEILAENSDTGTIDTYNWIAKTNAFRSAKRVFANYWALWNASNGEIPMPKPIAFLNEPQWTLQEKVKGSRLGAQVNTEHFAENMQETARMIARFHSLEIPLCNTRKLDQELRMINPRCDILIHLMPELACRLGTLREQIVANLERRIDIRAPIHADFHHTNLLVDGRHVKLIDVDEMAFGDPCVDIGRFLSSLRIPSLRAFGSFEGLEPLRELFLETYLNNAPCNVQNIRLFESASLLTSAASAFRFQRPDWKNEVQMLLGDAERTFAKSKERKTLSLSCSSPRLRKLPIESRLRWALDKAYIQALLTPALFEKTQETITFCKCLGHSEDETSFRVSYKVITRNGKEKSKRELELLLFKKRGGRATYQQLIADSEARQSQGHLPADSEPIAYFTELGAIVFFSRTFLSSVTSSS